ncbi:hypothetical protein FPV67DRAFT_1449709 [Lyophyllum atratum]|nr:hypothetical protein FPV67DRAFT_1449709 [Lyophyllum atratum]
MPDLDFPILQPPDLQAENRPTVNELKARILPWVAYNFQKQVGSNVHYENQLYGPWNSFLSSIFPLERQFMVIPQAIIRRVITDPADIDEDLGNVSAGSTGAIHESRHMSGTEIEKGYPDFMPVKVTLVEGNIRHHHAMCIIEVKAPQVPLSVGHRQILAYLKTMAAHPRREKPLFGFLVAGSIVRTYELREVGNGRCKQVESFAPIIAQKNRHINTRFKLMRSWNVLREHANAFPSATTGKTSDVPNEILFLVLRINEDGSKGSEVARL